MSDTLTAQGIVTVALPRKLVNELARALRARKTGNFVIHLNVGEPLGFTFEQKDRLSEQDRRDEVVLG